MPAPVTVKNATDTYTAQAPNKGYPNAARIWLRNAVSNNKKGLIFFAKPWSPGSVILSAKLQFWNVDNWSTSTTITVQRAASKWSVNKVNYTGMPAGTGATATLNKASAAPNTMWEIDVTALIQSVANGAPWYGFIITTSRTVDGAIYSTQAGTGTMRPVLVVTWNDPPEEPDNLRLRDNRQTSLQYPTLAYDYNDPQGDSDLNAQQIQFGASQALLDGGTATFDSGEVPTAIPEFVSNTATPGGTWAGLADLASTWWRVRAKDATGAWSPWADAQQFGRTTKGVLAITAPTVAGIFEGSPVVTWTLTGRTQKAYQVYIAKASDPNTLLWDSGKVTSTATSQAIPFGIIKDASATYRITVLVWDTINRESTPGDPVYYEQTVEAAIAYDAAVTNVTSLAAASDPLLPVEHITFTSAVAPDSFQLQRSADGGTTWEYVSEKLPAEVLVSGSNYQIDDVAAAQYVAYNWRVLRIVAGRQSGGSIPTTSGQVRKLAPFLVRKDGTDAVCFLNPRRKKDNLDIQEIHDTMAGPVLVTQRIGGKHWEVEGRFTADSMPGVTAKQQANRFERLRADSGVPLTLFIADEAFNVVAYNMQIDTVTDAYGITYQASIEAIEVPST